MLLDTDRRVYKAMVGMHVSEQPRGDTPCERTVLGNEVYEIADAFLDSASVERGIELGGRVFRFYAGAPLTTPGRNQHRNIVRPGCDAAKVE